MEIHHYLAASSSSATTGWFNEFPSDVQSNSLAALFLLAKKCKCVSWILYCIYIIYICKSTVYGHGLRTRERICHCQHGCRTSESEELVDWDWALGDGSWEAAARAFGQVININAKCHVLHFTKHSFPFSFFYSLD